VISTQFRGSTVVPASGTRVDIECGDTEDKVNDLIVASDLKQEVDSSRVKKKTETAARKNHIKATTR